MKREPCAPKRRKRGCETAPKKEPVKPKASAHSHWAGAQLEEAKA